MIPKKGKGTSLRPFNRAVVKKSISIPTVPFNPLEHLSQDLVQEVSSSPIPTTVTGTLPRITRTSKSSSGKPNSSISSGNANAKPIADGRLNLTVLDTLDVNSLMPTATFVDSCPNSASLKLGIDCKGIDAVEAPSCPALSTPYLCSFINSEKSHCGKDDKSNVPREILPATATESNEVVKPHQFMGGNSVENSAGDATGCGTMNPKPLARKVVKVVKRVIKRRVIKKVPKSLPVSLTQQSEKPHSLEAENPDTISGNMLYSPTSEMVSGNIEFSCRSEGFKVLDSDPVKEIENLEISEVEKSEISVVEKSKISIMDGIPKNPIQNFPVSTDGVENRISSVNTDIPDLPVDISHGIPASMEIENINECDFGDGLNDGSVLDVPSKSQSTDAGEAMFTETGVEDIEFNNAMVENIHSGDLIEEHSEKFNLGDVRNGCKEFESSNEVMVLNDKMEALERRKRRKTELFLGGLHKDAKEEDIRKVFAEVGKIVEVRLMMNVQTGKNKGYAFLRYASASDAKRALENYSIVKICGKECEAVPVEGNDTIFLGNLDKQWKSEDVMKLLRDAGIEKIDTLTVMPDPSNIEFNRGFAFLELETMRDAQNAFKKLQKKDVFGNHIRIRVDWAEPLVELNEEDMQKVASVYAQFVPSSWNEGEVKDFFQRFGKIDNVVLARDLQSHSHKRKDFAFVNFTSRESALSCIESFSQKLFEYEGSKVNMRVSFAKPPKGKHNKRASNYINKEIPNKNRKPYIQRVSEQTNKGKYLLSTRNDRQVLKNHRCLSTNTDHVRMVREQQLQSHAGSAFNGVHPYSMSGRKRPVSALGIEQVYSNPRGYPRTHMESLYPTSSASSSYDSIYCDVPTTASHPYYQRLYGDYRSGYERLNYRTSFQQRGDAPYRGNGGLYNRY